MRAVHRTFASGQNQYKHGSVNNFIYGVIKKDYNAIIGQRESIEYVIIFVWCMFFVR